MRLVLFFAAFLFAAPAALAADAPYRETKWEALVPKDWDPAKQFKALDLSKLRDSDPQAMDALQQLKAAWDSAPAEPSMDGARVRIPGFILPLEREGEKVREFLLVPYFGACIHSPPPPANQIIQVSLAKPANNVRTMDAVWVSGTLEIFRADTPWGAAGYRMKGVRVEAYKEPAGAKR